MKNKEIVKEVSNAFLKSDIEKALSFMSEDIKMGWPGYFDLAPGKDSIREFFKDVPEMLSSETGEFIEEGDRVVGTGRITAKHANGEVKKSFFCDVYQLKDGEIKEITSYMVFENREDK
ncbi:MAG: nuclear transport factor 2 family protein [Cyclobacteriaceae bacterium]